MVRYVSVLGWLSSGRLWTAGDRGAGGGGLDGRGVGKLRFGQGGDRDRDQIDVRTFRC